MATLKRPTIAEVAQSAGVSQATVSRVMNGKASVDAELAARVVDAARQLNYVPNTSGRALRRQRSHVWALIVPDIQNPFFTALVSDFEAVAGERGVPVMLCATNDDLAKERRYIEAAVAQQMAGVLIAVASERKTDLTPLEQAGIPVVLIDRRVRRSAANSVTVDNELVGRLAAEHLLDQGVRRAACLTGGRDVSPALDRGRGFCDAMAAAGHPVAAEHVVATNLRVEGSEREAERLLADDTIEALFCVNGLSTAGGYQAIQRLHRTMPDDLALIGVDDDHWTRMVDPQVSVVVQPVRELARWAAELLTRAEGAAGDATNIVLAPRLVVRGSTLRAPAGSGG